jgi:hypothetical protein
VFRSIKENSGSKETVMQPPQKRHGRESNGLINMDISRDELPSLSNKRRSSSKNSPSKGRRTPKKIEIPNTFGQMLSRHNKESSLQRKDEEMHDEDSYSSEEKDVPANLNDQRRQYLDQDPQISEHSFNYEGRLNIPHRNDQSKLIGGVDIVGKLILHMLIL